MSAHENLSDQFVTVYRGRPHYNRWPVPKTQDDLKGLGIHWTTELDVARHFAGGWDISDWEPDHRTGKKPTEMGGHVLYGKVHKQHIIEPRTAEWDNLSLEHSIMEPEDTFEKEVTIRERAPVEIVGVEQVRNKSKITDNSPNNYSIRKSKFTGGMGTA